MWKPARVAAVARFPPQWASQRVFARRFCVSDQVASQRAKDQVIFHTRLVELPYN